MNETIKTVVAYGGLVLGFPLLAAKVAWYVPGTILSKILQKMVHRLDLIIDGAAEGFLSILFACLIFERMGVAIIWAVPGILMAVTLLWESGKEESDRKWSTITAILIGYFLYPGILRYLTEKFEL